MVIITDFTDLRLLIKLNESDTFVVCLKKNKTYDHLPLIK